jgi:hypothetical protein
MQLEIAKSVIAQMGGQIDLLITLALGICGGLAALLLQVTLHNSDPAKNSVVFKLGFLIFLCLFCEGASIVAGYLSRASITSLTPKILSLDFSKIGNWTQATFDGSHQLRTFTAAQGILFMLGIVFVMLFLIANAGLHRSAKRESTPPGKARSSLPDDPRARR